MKLSEITDADAIDVAKIFAQNSLPKPLLASFGKECIDHVFNHRGASISLTPDQVIRVYQYLQFRGYGVPIYYHNPKNQL